MLEYSSQDSLLLALPPGGIEVAKQTGIQLEAFISTRLSLPNEPNYTIDALAED